MSSRLFGVLATLTLVLGGCSSAPAPQASVPEASPSSIVASPAPPTAPSPTPSAPVKTPRPATASEKTTKATRADAAPSTATKKSKLTAFQRNYRAAVAACGKSANPVYDGVTGKLIHCSSKAADRARFEGQLAYLKKSRQCEAKGGHMELEVCVGAASKAQLRCEAKGGAYSGGKCRDTDQDRLEYQKKHGTYRSHEYCLSHPDDPYCEGD